MTERGFLLTSKISLKALSMLFALCILQGSAFAAAGKFTTIRIRRGHTVQSGTIKLVLEAAQSALSCDEYVTCPSGLSVCDSGDIQCFTEGVAKTALQLATDLKAGVEANCGAATGIEVLSVGGDDDFALMKITSTKRNLSCCVTGDEMPMGEGVELGFAGPPPNDSCTVPNVCDGIVLNEDTETGTGNGYAFSKVENVPSLSPGGRTIIFALVLLGTGSWMLRRTARRILLVADGSANRNIGGPRRPWNSRSRR